MTAEFRCVQSEFVNRREHSAEVEADDLAEHFVDLPGVGLDRSESPNLRLIMEDVVSTLLRWW